MSDFKANIEKVHGGYQAYVSRNDDLARDGYSDYEVPIFGKVIGKDMGELLENVFSFLADRGCSDVELTGLLFGWASR